MRTPTELTDDEDENGIRPGPDDEAWTVEADGPTSKFPMLARFGIIMAGGVLTLIVALLVLPMLLPASMTIGPAERVIRDLTGLEINIEGAHSFRVLPSMRLTAENITGVAAGENSVQASAARLDVELSALGILAGRVDVQGIHLLAPDVRVQMDAVMAPDREGAHEFNRSWGWWRDLTLQSLNIANARVQIESSDRGYRMTLEDFTLADAAPAEDEPMDGLVLEGAGMLNGKPVTVRAAGADPQLLVSGNRWPVQARMNSDLLRIDFEGALSMRQTLLGNGDLRLQSEDMSALNNWLGVMLPARAGSALTLATAFGVVESGFELSAIQLDTGETRATGDIRITRDEKGTPTVDGSLQAQTLDLGGITDSALNAGTQPVWIMAGMPAGRMALTWRRLLWRDVEVGAGSALLTRAAGTGGMELVLKDTAANGGTVRGKLALDSSEGMRALNGTLRAIDVELGPFLAPERGGALPPLSGQASLEVKLFSVGATAQQLLRALTGNAELIVRDGVLAMTELVAGLAPEQGETIPFQTLNARFRIAQGIASNDDLILRTPNLNLVGTGRIDLADWLVDFNIGRLGGDGGGVKRFRVSGPALQVNIEAIN